LETKEKGEEFMQFVVTAHDGANMLERRMQVRPRHLENMAAISKTGRVIVAGGLQDAEGKPCGSVLVLEYETREQLDEYLASEPYIIEKVWEDVKVEPIKVVIIDDQKVGN
jgi:hypothetical protein